MFIIQVMTFSIEHSWTYNMVLRQGSINGIVKKNNDNELEVGQCYCARWLVGTTPASPEWQCAMRRMQRTTHTWTGDMVVNKGFLSIHVVLSLTAMGLYYRQGDIQTV